MVGSTATKTGNLFFSFCTFNVCVGLDVVVVVNSSGKGVKGLKLYFDKKLSTERFCLIFSSVASVKADVAETTNRNSPCN